MKEPTEQTIAIIKQLINEALQISPNRGNGYGLLVAVILFIFFAGSALAVWRWWVGDKRAKEERQDKAEKWEKLIQSIEQLENANREENERTRQEIAIERDERKNEDSKIRERMARLER